MAFLLAAAFPALAVPLVLASGLTLFVLGLITGFAGKRWRAYKLVQAQRVAAEIAGAETGAWPTGRHAQRGDAPPEPAAEPARSGAAQPHAA
ncbi:hypothetical protein [Pseudonocardia phyllosphaerae]|uniref:hypothetical protein n=1 Tax=Pseudonocardia phyllosphaerae TaxID=3390502 RepID=UPI00397B498C